MPDTRDPAAPAAVGDAAAGGRLRNYLALLRAHQWIKNVFVLAPLFFTPDALSVAMALHVLLGAACFCAVSSAVYIVNDFVDREADRRHPRKRHRPLAAGTISTVEAFLAFSVLVLIGVGGAWLLAPPFAALLVAYFALNLAYSLKLKHLSIVDLLSISAGFVLRVDGGAMLIGVPPSEWILLCTGLLALFIAIGKRRDDLVKDLGTEHRPSLEGYTTTFLDIAATMVLGALLVSYAIYTTDAAVMARLGSERLYLTVPFVLAGVLRYVQIIVVEERSGSPTTVVLTDRFMIVTVLGWMATFAVLIYG
ncbi:MAG: decaprenyl-phosphate phosphoribosyltransferase [Inquilinus sp.]|nr:decaprenyl-phosphate phosphoribosyltransferase [Inquilinus sp.]